MLRSNPQPPGKYCLSIDPGTQNAGVCAFDSITQTIVYWNRHKLLDAHEQVVRSTDQVKRYLDSITDNVEAALPRHADYWVLVEQQPWDSDSKKGIVFNLQLQQAIVMYYLCKGKSVRVLSASERYKFLGIRNWQQMTRHFRKVSTANAVRQLLEPREDSSFAGRNHDLRMWQAAEEQQHDMADALGQLLRYYYRNVDGLTCSCQRRCCWCARTWLQRSALRARCTCRSRPPTCLTSNAAGKGQMWHHSRITAVLQDRQVSTAVPQPAAPHHFPGEHPAAVQCRLTLTQQQNTYQSQISLGRMALGSCLMIRNTSPACIERRL